MQKFLGPSPAPNGFRRRLHDGTAAYAVLAWCLLAAGAAHAQSLDQALQETYSRSEQIADAQAEHEADEAGIAISRADGLPSVVTNVDLTETLAGEQDRTGRVSVQGRATVPLYQGGSVRNAVRAARSRSDASLVAVSTAEMEVFSDVVSAYANVIRDQQIVELSRANLDNLITTLDATRARYRARDLTRTDVAQAESRSALARGELETAEARLQASSLEFQRLTGLVPTDLESLPALADLPATAEDAATTALEENPQLVVARSLVESRRYEMQAARGAGLPSVSAVATGRYSDGQPVIATQTDSRFGASVGLSLNMPLFQGGRTSARVRQASVRETQAQLNVRDIERTLVARARTDFVNWQAAGAVVDASEQAVQAARQALSGVRAESDVGSRTILDILNAEQELRNARVQLVTAQRDSYVAAFSLLTTMGRTQARHLGIERDREAQDLVGPQIDYAPVNPRARSSDHNSAPTSLAQTDESSRVEPVSVEVELPPSAPPPPAIAEDVRTASAPQAAAPAAPRPRREDVGEQAARASLIPPTHWVIQLAAHSEAGAARNHWNQVAASVRQVVADAVPLVAVAATSPRRVYRLAIGSFAEFTNAETACHDLREQGLSCIVRRYSTLGTIEWSDRATTNESAR